MKIAIGSDHRGYQLKESLKSFLEGEGYTVIDVGTNSKNSVDYPDYAFKVGELVRDGYASLGILICMTGIGMSIAANKVRGVRAALVVDEERAKLARAHNNANVLALPGGYMTEEEAIPVVKAFLKTDFEGGRHERRIRKIEDYESR